MPVPASGPHPSFLRAARQYVATMHGEPAAAAFARTGELRLDLDDSFPRAVADDFDQQPTADWNERLAAGYTAFQRENVAQWHAIVATGLTIEPWLEPGQPYRSSSHLLQSVQDTGRLFVFLTRNGHGSDVAGSGQPAHPMRGPSGIRVSGVELEHNDVFRAVHDTFGHLMFRHDMGPVGELRAAHCHLTMYSRPARPVLFTEQVSQICWFFHGAHLRDGSGRLPARGGPGWIPPGRRPFPPQKVFECPPRLLAMFASAFTEEAA